PGTLLVGHVRSGNRSHSYRSHQRSGSHRSEEHSPALPSQKALTPFGWPLIVGHPHPSPWCFAIRCNRARNGPGTLPIGHVRIGNGPHTYRSHRRSGSHRSEEHSPALPSQKALTPFV